MEIYHPTTSHPTEIKIHLPRGISSDHVLVQQTLEVSGIATHRYEVEDPRIYKQQRVKSLILI